MRCCLSSGRGFFQNPQAAQAFATMENFLRSTCRAQEPEEQVIMGDTCVKVLCSESSRFWSVPSPPARQ